MHKGALQVRQLSMPSLYQMKAGNANDVPDKKSPCRDLDELEAEQGILVTVLFKLFIEPDLGENRFCDENIKCKEIGMWSLVSF